MGFRLVSKLVTFYNDHEGRNGPYFALFHRIFVYDIVVKQLGLPPFQNLLLIVDYSMTILKRSAQLFSDYLGKNKLITRFDGRRCIDD